MVFCRGTSLSLKLQDGVGLILLNWWWGRGGGGEENGGIVTVVTARQADKPVTSTGGWAGVHNRTGNQDPGH